MNFKQSLLKQKVIKRGMKVFPTSHVLYLKVYINFFQLHPASVDYWKQRVRTLELNLNSAKTSTDSIGVTSNENTLLTADIHRSSEGKIFFMNNLNSISYFVIVV
jgi:hypothetical protein